MHLKNTRKYCPRHVCIGSFSIAYGSSSSVILYVLLPVFLGFVPPDTAAEGAGYSVSHNACSELRGLKDVMVGEDSGIADVSPRRILGCPVFTFFKAARTEVRLGLANTSEGQRAAYCTLKTRLRFGQAREEASRVVVPRKSHAVDMVWQISTGEASHGYIVCRLSEGMLLDAIHYRGREEPEGLTPTDGLGRATHRVGFDRLLDTRGQSGVSAAPGCVLVGTEEGVAVGQGFEPREPLGSTVFKTAAFDHSASPPTSPALGWRRAHYSCRHRGFKA